MQKDYPSLLERLVIFGINSFLALTVFYWSTGLVVPNGGLESTWVLSALTLWTISLLSTPWFTPPRDVLVNALGALLVLTTMSLDVVIVYKGELEHIRIGGMIYCIFVIIICLCNLVIFDRQAYSPFGRLTYKLANIFGKPEVLYSIPALIGTLGAFQYNFEVTFSLVLGWMLIVIGQPIERLASALRAYGSDKELAHTSVEVGLLERIDDPGIFRIKLKPRHSWRENELYAVRLPNDEESYCLALFSQTQGSEVIATGIALGPVETSYAIPVGSVCSCHNSAQLEKLVSALCGKSDARIAGFIVEGSSIGQVNFEISSSLRMREGDLVLARIESADVFYQVVDAETEEESFDSNPRGKQIVRATQLGCYDDGKGFTRFNWLPKMNTPVFVMPDTGFQSDVENGPVLGRVPGSGFKVSVDLDELIYHHSAILGVTGTGKTELALALVEECITAGAKVICVDFTGEYRERLKHHAPVLPNLDNNSGSRMEDLIFAIDAGGFHAKDEKHQLKKLLEQVRSNAEKEVKAFLLGDASLAILELAEISNTKLSLILTETYLSAVMNWARENRRAKKILMCLEEAHTIIPEPYGSGLDSETKRVVERIGQIALQGRKYGVGLMLVSQRTALVSKTILSQCNTFFTHALIDQTSLNFLESVYSSRHIRLIPNLGRFHFLAFGKAVRSERPIVLERPFDEAIAKASDALNKTSVSAASNVHTVQKADTLGRNGPRVTFMPK